MVPTYPSYIIKSNISTSTKIIEEDDEEEETAVAEETEERIEFDCVETRETTYDASVPEYALEGGAYTSDTVLKKPITVKITAMITNMPVTWKRLHDESNRVELVKEALEDVYFAGELVTLVTPKRVYENMAMESLSLPENDYENAMEVEMTLKRIEITDAKTITSDDYEYSGASEEDAGTIDTQDATASAQGIEDADWLSDYVETLP